MPRAAWLLFVLVVSASFAPSAPATHRGSSALHITSDTDFSASHWSGSGTAADPYRPIARTFVAGGGYAVELSGTQKHVNLTGLTITGGGTSSDAIRIVNARNVTVHGSTLEANRYGIHVRGSSDVTIVGNTVKTSQVGVFLESSRAVTVRDNRLSLNEKDVELKLSTKNVFTDNALSVATGQFGFHFDDNTSYDNSIATTNLVNSIPVRWYAGLVGEPDEPIVISDIVVDLPKMTNVAQIMVHNSSYVRLDRPVAKGGAGSGIVLHRTAGVELVRPTTDGNAAHGVLLELANDTTVSDGSSRNNTQHGLLLQSTRDTLVERATATGNRGQGARVAAARDTTLQELVLANNSLGGVAAEGARGLTLEDSALTSNGVAEVALSASTDVIAENNTLAGAGATGFLVAGSGGTFTQNNVTGHTPAFSFVGATGSSLSGNNVTPPRGGIGFAFDGPRSYDNALATTNLVNGTPVRWYTHVVGPLTLEDVRVEQAGITNVAQIMLFKTRNVTLTNATARNGTAAGIVAYVANDTNVSNATVADNAAQGVLAVQSLRFELSASTVARSGSDGVKLVSSTAAFIENDLIEDGKARGIAVETSSAPTLRGNAVARHPGIGIHLDRVGPGGAAADHNVIERNLGGGIIATSSTVGTLHANALDSNGPDGISLSTVPVGARLDANEIANHTRGIRLAIAAGTQLTANLITISPGQTGIHFADEASYEVTMPPTNLVNGTPVRWYNGTGNATIAAPEVELPGITNVAQIMLNKVYNVTVTGALAANGSARGLYVLRSHNVTIEDSVSRGNAQQGAVVRLSGGTSILRSSFEDNGAAGVALDAAPSPGARLDGLVVTGNLLGITATASALALLNGSELADNGARGLLLTASGGANVSHSTFEGHTHAVHLTMSPYAAFTDNTVALSTNATAWHFDDEVSYEGTVDETNLVEGTPMRWYARREGLSLIGVRAETRGMTNVAQVMLYRSDGATLDDIHAANGSARGIVIHRSEDVRLGNSTARNNTADGIQVNASGGAVLDNVTARDNAGDGIEVAAGGHALVNGSAVANNAGAGARVVEAGATLAGTRAQRNGAAGIVVDRVTATLLTDNDVLDEPTVGIAVRNTTGGARLDANRIANATQGIAFLQSEFVNVTENAITKATAQTGLHFSDERSYNNLIATSNAVNGMPVHWYTTLTGTEADPIVLADVRSELRGVTNVAQVMLYRSAYVALPGAVATNGTAHGIYLYRSSAIAVEWANASGNAGSGVQLQATQSSTIRDLHAQKSGVGVRVNESHNNVIRRVNATGASVGVVLDALSRDDLVDAVETNGTAPGVTDASWKGTTLVGNNLVLDGGATKRVKLGSSVTLNGTLASYRLEASRIVSQSVSFGDNSTNESSSAAVPFRPTHTYAALGTYRVTLSATTADGHTLADSVFVEVLPPLSAPRALTAAPGARNVTLTWSAPSSDGASPITKYRIYRGTNDSVVPFLGEVTGGTTTFVDAGLVNGADYAYQVSAVNADGEGPKAKTTATPVSTPGAPDPLAAVPLPNATLLTWSPPADTGGLTIRGYDVLRSSRGSPFAVVASVRNATNTTVDGLTNGVAYTFAVRATSSAGPGLLSANATVTPVGPPGAPRAVKVLAGDAAASLLWSSPTDTGGAPVTGYKVWRGTSNETFVALPATIPETTFRFRDTGLSNGETYHYAVSALNVAGEGTRSSITFGVPTAIDSLRPVVFDRDPAPGAILIESPAVVRAQFVDNEGIVVESVRVYLDGSQVGAAVDEIGATYDVPQALAPGEHTVRIVVRDPRGNEADETWTFRILAEDELVPRFELADHALLPSRVDPGAPVSARVSVRNVGYAPGNISVAVVLGNVTVAREELALEPGAEREVLLGFEAPATAGSHEVLIHDERLMLVVGAAEPEPQPEAPSPDEPEEPVGPTRDLNVSPRELPTADTPFPGVAALLLLFAIVAMRRRKA